MPAVKHIQMIGAPLYLVPIGSGGFNGGWQPKEYVDASGGTHSTAVYKVQPGDTLNALAQRYMGSTKYAKAIWDWQSADFKAKRGSINNIVVGDVLQMPLEAVDGAAALGFVPKELAVFDPLPGIGPAFKPAGGGGTAPKPPGGGEQPNPPAPSGGLSKAAWWGLGLGALGLAAGAYAFRKPIKRALVAA